MSDPADAWQGDAARVEEGSEVYRKILVGVDGSEPSKKAMHAAVQLARIHGASLHALGVEEHLPRYPATIGEVEESKEEMDNFFVRVMEDARLIAEEYGVGLTTEVLAGNPAQHIVLRARNGAFDLIVLGAKGHNIIRDFLLGVTTDRVSHHAPCSVLIVR
jgi:nucleotide-binding universal stress UspA family protein